MEPIVLYQVQELQLKLPQEVAVEVLHKLVLMEVLAEQQV